MLLDTGPMVAFLKADDVEIDSVSRVVAKYGPRRTDLADACLVRMSELHVDSAVLTVDSQFRDVYRRNGRRVIETLMPGGVSGRRKRGR